ncbi:hypothetical protein [Terriglobus sp. RCC_193]|uniref:hypothetical protein n=1 Tax=Terriglobus sp. RCC_193 TaxID=3239218 RepID=UPI0035231A0D
MEWTTRINGWETLDAKGHDALLEGAKSGLDVLGSLAEATVQDLIRTPFGDKPPAVASGNLASSIMHETDIDQGMLRLLVGVSPRLGADQYADAVEDGSRPHMPPYDALDAWVLLKFHPDTEEQAREIANGVLRKIYYHGTKPHHMFERALPEVEKNAVPVLEKQIAQAFLRAGFGVAA